MVTKTVLTPVAKCGVFVKFNSFFLCFLYFLPFSCIPTIMPLWRMKTNYVNVCSSTQVTHLSRKMFPLATTCAKASVLCGIGITAEGQLLINSTDIDELKQHFYR